MLEGKALLFQKDAPMKAFGTAVSRSIMAPLAFLLLDIYFSWESRYFQSIAGASALCVLGGEENVPPDPDPECTVHCPQCTVSSPIQPLNSIP